MLLRSLSCCRDFSSWCFPELIYNSFNVFFLRRCCWKNPTKPSWRSRQGPGNGKSKSVPVFFLFLCFSVYLGEAVLTLFLLREEEHLGPSSTAVLRDTTSPCQPVSPLSSPWLLVQTPIEAAFGTLGQLGNPYQCPHSRQRSFSIAVSLEFLWHRLILLLSTDVPAALTGTVRSGCPMAAGRR